MKDFFIADAAKYENTNVVSYFALATLQVRDRKQGGKYLAVTLSDKTGVMEGRMWEEFADTLATCKEGSYVKAQGLINKYQNKYQITLQKLRLAADSEIDVADYLPATTQDVEAMWKQMRGYVNSFQNADLKRLVFAFLDDQEIAEAYKYAPAAKLLHHAWVGGLLEHVIGLLKVCDAVAPLYPEADRDLLMTGAILHDIGKTRELSWKSSFSYTLEGMLVGHISIAMGMLREKVQQIAPFPEKLRILVEHLILSHHGKFEFGSPKLPMVPEALVFSAIDDLEAKMQAVRSEFATQINNGGAAGELTERMWALDNRQVLNTKRWLEEKE